MPSPLAYLRRCTQSPPDVDPLLVLDQISQLVHSQSGAALVAPLQLSPAQMVRSQPTLIVSSLRA